MSSGDLSGSKSWPWCLTSGFKLRGAGWLSSRGIRSRTWTCQPVSRCSRCHKSYVAVEMDRDPSRGHEPICASCATGHNFRAAALAESTTHY